MCLCGGVPLRRPPCLGFRLWLSLSLSVLVPVALNVALPLSAPAQWCGSSLPRPSACGAATRRVCQPHVMGEPLTSAPLGRPLNFAGGLREPAALASLPAPVQKWLRTAPPNQGPMHGGATTTGPDATYPPAICQNSGGGGGGGGGSGRGSGGGSGRESGGGPAGGRGGGPTRGPGGVLPGVRGASDGVRGGGVRVRVGVKVRVKVSPRVRVTELVEPVLVL